MLDEQQHSCFPLWCPEGRPDRRNFIAEDGLETKVAMTTAVKMEGIKAVWMVSEPPWMLLKPALKMDVVADAGLVVADGRPSMELLFQTSQHLGVRLRRRRGLFAARFRPPA